MLLEGKRFEVNFRSPARCAGHGASSTIYQEVNLLALRTVAENIFLGREQKRYGDD
jgi:monosaccharide-transporting ATPase